MKRYLVTLSMVVTIASPFSPLQAGDLVLGRLKAEQVCQTCHGVDGMAVMAGVPNLAGQQEEYLVHQLEAFRAGQRQHAQMSIIAQGLSDDDIGNVSAWYANIRISAELPSIE